MLKFDVAYYRYVDDVLIYGNYDEVNSAYHSLRRRLKYRGLNTHPPTSSKTHLGFLNESFSFLGYVFNANIITVRDSTVESFILVVSLTSVLTRLSPVQIPLPLIQIAAGALLAQPIFGLHVEFNPELFLLLFIPPLLFAESSKIQPKELIKHSREIVSLALVLVLITIFGVGYVIHLDMWENLFQQASQQ